MTICFVTDGYPGQTGGIATFNQNVSSLLTAAGHQVIILTADYENSGPARIATEGLITRVSLGESYQRIYRDWAPYFRAGGFNAPNWIAIGMAAREWLVDHHKTYEIDVIEAADYGGAGIFLCDAGLPPLLITGHGSLSQFSPYNYTGNDANARVVQQLEALSCQHADAVISHSPVNSTALEKQFREANIRLALMPWTSEYTEETTATETGNMLTVGGLQPVKGVYDIFEALQLLHERNISFPFQWIGGDTWLAPHYRQMSKYLARKFPETWQQHFNWLNEMSPAATRTEMNKAALVIIPSLFETFNYVALEAASHKKAILVTAATGAAAYFTHGKNAWIIPPGNAAALAEAMTVLMENPDLRRELGENAGQMVKQLFTPNAIVESRISIYREVISNRKQQAVGLHPSLHFLGRYRSIPRKWYYISKGILKKLTGRK